MRRRHVVLAGIAARVASLSLTPAAQAAVSRTAVTSPAAPYFDYIDDQDLSDASNIRTASGTSDGTTGDQLKLWCGNLELASDVPVDADGTWPTTFNLRALSWRVCTLQALPASVPADHSNFTGPLVGVGEQEQEDAGSSTYAYWLSQVQAAGYAEYWSIGDLALSDMALIGPDGVWGPYLFSDDASLGDTYSTGEAQHQYAVVDDQPVFFAGTAISKSSAPTHLPTMSFTRSTDARTGDTAVVETDEAAHCVAEGTPSCADFADSGVTVHRTIRQDDNGRTVTFTDDVTSTDGRPHTFAFDYDQYENANGYRFPGESAYSGHAGGDTVTISGAASPYTIGVIADRTAAPSLADPVGAITVSPTPDRALFTKSSGFNLLFRGSVPAGGATRITQTYNMSDSESELAAAVARVRAASGSPSPSSPSPSPSPSPSSTPAPTRASAVAKLSVVSINVVKRGALRLTAKCSGTKCAGLLKAVAKGHPIVVAKRRFTVAAGKHVVTVKPTEAGKKLLMVKETITAKVKVTEASGP